MKGPLNRRQFLRRVGHGAAWACLPGCASAPESGGGLEPRSAGGPVETGGATDLARVAIERLKRAGCTFGDVRLIQTRVQTITARDGHPGDTDASSGAGYGVRALIDGSWGFASDVEFTPDAVRRTVERAVGMARAVGRLTPGTVQWADEPVHADTVVTPRRIDPFDVSVDDKLELLTSITGALTRSEGVVRSRAWVWAQSDVKLLVNTDGSELRYDLTAVGARCTAWAGEDDDVQSRSFVVPFHRGGWEHVLEYDMPSQVERVAAEAVEKSRAPEPAPGAYDLVLDPGNLALTLHETCGHPTQLDAALRDAGSGGGFLDYRNLGRFAFGSRHVNLWADDTRPGTLAGVGYDDDGVAAQRWPIVDAGVWVGVSSNREFAAAVGAARSRGCGHADGWASVPLLRIPNIGLEGGHETPDTLVADVRRGVYIEGGGSLSVDPSRLRFQFGGDAFWEIRDGRVGGMLKNVSYGGTTPQFWRACDGVAASRYAGAYGFIRCEKGQPGQQAWMTHAAPPARFRRVEVLPVGGASVPMGSDAVP